MRVSVLTKLLGGFGVVVALLLAVGLFGVAAIDNDHAHLNQLVKESLPSTRAVGDISALMNKYRQNQLRYIVDEPAERAPGAPGSMSDKLAGDLTSMRQVLFKLSGLIEDPSGGRMLSDLRAGFATYVRVTAGFRGLADAGSRTLAADVVGSGPGDRAFSHLKVLVANLNGRIAQESNASAASSYSSYHVGLTLLIGLLGAAVAIALAVAIPLSRGITRAVHQIGMSAKATAQGDIGQHVAVKSRDELGDMARDFDLMIDYLRSISGVAETIAAGDLSVDVQPRSERDALGKSLAAMTRSLRGLVREKDQLMEQIPGVVMVFDIYPDGSRTFVFVSRQSETLLGIEPSAFLTGAHNFMECVHVEDREPLRVSVREPAAAGLDPLPAEFRFIRPDGREVWVRVQAALVYSERGVHRLQSLLFDITDAKQAELERERLELDLRLAQKLEAIGSLAAGVAHEINTPVQFIGDSVTFLKEAVDELLKLTNVYSDLLHTEEPIDKRQRQRRAVAAEQESDLEYLTERVPPAFERALEGIARVSSIVRAMRQFAHPSSQRAPIDINEGLRTTLIVATNEYKYVADIELDLANLPPVMANAGDLNQVFLNLIVNAAHAIQSRVRDSAQRGTITVRTRADTTGVLITVSDTGCGIPDEIAERVFDPFFTTKAVGHGTGQGLAIAHAIVVERHHGAINFEPNPDGGTTFRIHLPLDDPAAPGDPAAPDDPATTEHHPTTTADHPTTPDDPAATGKIFAAAT
jgi:PAS domain S-box-containing protein